MTEDTAQVLIVAILVAAVGIIFGLINIAEEIRKLEMTARNHE